jgi:glycine amidinotransferase/scyllo-inosamine-4-phosphate amidinotransferase 1
MKINSHNEWDKLREIIVGRAEGHACLHFSTPLSLSDEVLEKAEALARKAFPQWLVDEIAEDLEGLCHVLKSFGVKVLRPNPSHVTRQFVTPYFSASGDHVYNMRDLHLVVGNTVVESPSQEKHRYFETMGIYDIWYEYLKEGFRWICGPKPRLDGEYMITYYEGGNMQYEDGQKFIKLTENEILFEAANTVRMGRDLLYLVSRSGNYLGAKWLQTVLGDEYRVHTTAEIYRSSHIDSTVLCLRPGLVLLNTDRVNPSKCPKVLDKWEKIYFGDIVATPGETVNFHEQVRKPISRELASLGIESGIDSIASPWIGMNVLSVDRQTVIVDERQLPLIKVLEKHHITPVPIRFRHSYYMGGIHCSTLDTVRDSVLESYFD